MGKTGIILGATGLTGGLLLSDLLNSESCDKVKSFSRSTVGFSHPKMEEHLVDLFELSSCVESFTGDVVFCCIGTTKAKTPDKEMYVKIDRGIPVAAAKLAKANSIETFIVISAMGADSNSRVFYNKVKGEMEEGVLNQNIPNTYILQPSLIGGKRSEKRLGEQLAKFFFGVFSFLIPKKYQMIAPEVIAIAMQKLAINGADEPRISSNMIQNIATQP